MYFEKYGKYIELARSLGAVSVFEFDIDDIVFDPRTILKCCYGCDDYGKLCTCPSDPRFPGIEESIRIFKHYTDGIIIHAHDKHTSQKASYEVERAAFLDGHHFAFSLSDCGLCSHCAGYEGLPCRNQKMARPAFHSVGIDVFSTVRRFGINAGPLRTKDEEQNWFSAVFID